MRLLDASTMQVVAFGKEWPHPDIDPSSRGCIGELERNEGLVTWLQPVGGGVEDQIPAIRVRDKFCALSLRMQKSLFRHVRLRKNFVNREPLSDGTFKLRIPLLLLQEKVRTQTRFNMMRCKGDAYSQAAPAQDDPNKDRRGVSVMSKRIDAVIRDTFLPMADSLPSMPTCTGFTFTEHDMLCTVIKDILFRDCPNMVASKALLLDAVSRAYDEAVSGA